MDVTGVCFTFFLYHHHLLLLLFTFALFVLLSLFCWNPVDFQIKWNGGDGTEEKLWATIWKFVWGARTESFDNECEIFKEEDRISIKFFSIDSQWEMISSRWTRMFLGAERAHFSFHFNYILVFPTSRSNSMWIPNEFLVVLFK